MSTIRLHAAIGRTPQTAALLDGTVASDLLRLDFADLAPISRAFAPMVREARFDVCEMAIATFLQARAHAKPLVLLPVVLAARYQEPALLCRADSAIRGPADLAGQRIGVRAYSQTTGLWLRGILQDAHGLRPEQSRWVTFEDAHVAEYHDPPWATRAAPGQDMLAMLRDGTLDAAIFGNDTPQDPGLRTVFPDPAAASAAFQRTHGLVPVNHLAVVTRRVADAHPALVAELVRLFRAAATLAPPPLPWPASRDALQPALDLALRYATSQGLLPAPLPPAALWEGLPAASRSLPCTR